MPYYHLGAPWDRLPSPCVPFGEANDAVESRRRQRACLEFVDEQLGPLLDRFKAANTVICADHGDAWGEDGVWEHGVHHPKVMEVPLTFRLSNAPTGRVGTGVRTAAETQQKARIFTRKAVNRFRDNIAHRTTRSTP